MATGCRVKVPTLEEQQVLQQSGAFPGGTPAWVARSGPETSSPRRWSGIIPESFSAKPQGAGQPAPAEQERERKLSKDAEEKAAVETEKKESSPLERIAESCGGMDSSVNDALTTTDVGERIRKFSFLTSRCPSSWDLWLWLGHDQYQAGKWTAAAQSFERVLALNPGNAEAQSLLERAHRTQNTLSPEEW